MWCVWIIEQHGDGVVVLKGFSLASYLCIFPYIVSVGRPSNVTLTFYAKRPHIAKLSIDISFCFH